MNAAGQGCPLRVWKLALIFWVGWLTCAPAALAESELSFELRAVWGGGPVRSFGGSIKINNGSLSVVRNLSVQDDAVGTLQRPTPNQIAIVPHSASNFGGADLQVTGKPDSELEFVFDTHGKAATQTIKIRLQDVLYERVTRTIDAQGSRLSLERPLHDRVRMRLNDGRTILSSQDPCKLVVEGYQTGLPSADYRLTARLIDDATGRTLQQIQHDIAIDESGSFPPGLLSDLKLPERPGVYAVQVTFHRKRLISSIVANHTLPERRIEFVVAPAPRSEASDASSTDDQLLAQANWQEVDQLYPAGVSWWDSLGKFRVPAVKGFPPLVGQVTSSLRSISSGDHQRRMVQDSECMVLAKGAWHAFPLNASEIGLPHRVRLKVPADTAQQLVISVQEPSQASDGPTLRLDSGMIVEPTTGAGEHFVTHELVYWPKSTSAYLLVYNPDTASPAAVAEIVVEVARLAEAATNATLSPSPTGEANQLERLCSLYMDKPLLTENFGGQRRLDAAGIRELDSWRPTYQACERLAQYTRYTGFNTATITVACQGGAIYPSQFLTPSPKFDSGLFLADGSVPEVKDSVELLCRQFDHHGLRLILALDGDGALADLERITARIRQSSSTAEKEDEELISTDPELDAQAKSKFDVERLQAAQMSYYQVNLDGKLTNRENSGSADKTVHDKSTIVYNPLDARVQVALEKVVGELLERYGHHECFAGVQINLSQRSSFNFAGDLWGYDQPTLKRFEKSLGSSLPAAPQERTKLLANTLRLNFLNYRADQLSEFYIRLAERIAERSPRARLVLNPAKLIAMPPESDRFSQAAAGTMQPSDILLACGVNCERLAKSSKLVLLRPQTDSPLRSTPARAWSYQVESDSRLDTLISGKNAGLMVQQLPTSFRVPDFDKTNPFGSTRWRTWLFPHALLAGDAARRPIIERLYNQDLEQVVTGGWLIPMGQESALRSLVTTLQNFPPVSMHDLSLPATNASLRTRWLKHQSKLYVQLVHNASWSETIYIQLKSPVAAQVRNLGESEPAEPLPKLLAGEPTTIQLSMRPYSLIGLVVDNEHTEILSVTSAPPTDLPQSMQKRMAGLQSLIDRAGQLNEQQTLGLRGGDFENWNDDGQPVGWTVSTHPSTKISQENELPHTGRACVRLENRSENNATAWIQSDRLAIPSTGRLALEVWVRATPGPTQPVVRLSLMGRGRDGKRYQRWHEFVSGKPSSSRQQAREDSQLSDNWGRKPLVLLVPDVPSEDLAELNVAIDLIGTGIVYVDDVRVYGMFLHPDEQVQLSGQMFVASQQMRQGDYRLADQLLNSFWANFLATYLPTPAPVADPPVVNEARLPARSAPSGSGWRNPNSPRFNQWQENLKNRWQR